MEHTPTDPRVTAAVVNGSIETPTPDLSDALPLIDRLLGVAGLHDGIFVVVGIGEDPDTDVALTPEVVHVPNRLADRRSGLVAAIEQVSRRRGANAYIAPVLVRPDLAEGKEGEEADVLWQLAIVFDFEQEQNPATRGQRLPMYPHADVETSPGNFQMSLFFKRPYPPNQVEPVLQALAAKRGDDCKSLGHLVRLPGSLTWPNRREREKLGRSPVPVRAKLLMLMQPWEKGVALAELKAVMAVRSAPGVFPDFGGEPIGAKADFDRRPVAKADGAVATVVKQHGDVIARPAQAMIPTPNEASPAVDFLHTFLGETPWPLVAISATTRDIKAELFHAALERDAGADSWIKKFNDAGYGIYYGANPLKPDAPPATKAKKDDVAGATHLWVDLDPSKGLAGEALDTWRAEKLKELKRGTPPSIPPPTWIIDSGRGFQLLWRLHEPIPLDGAEGEATLFVESLNRGIERAFRGDDCHNIDRILRLPGTVNTKPEAGGRRACVVAHDPERAYVPGDFPAVGAHKPKAGAGVATVPDELPPVDVEVLDFSTLDPEAAEKVRATIKEGRYHDFADDRSAAVYFVCCAMIRADLPDVVILSTILDPRYKISEHVREQGEPRAYAQRQLRRALEAQPRPGPIVSDTDIMGRARIYRDMRRPHLLRFRGDFFDYASGRYETIGDDDVNAEVWRFLEQARARRRAEKETKFRPFEPNTRSVRETIAALHAVTKRGDRVEPPYWLDGRAEPSPSELLAFPNGLLDIRTGKLHPPDPNFFSLAACGFDYDPEAPTPEKWLAFLDQIYDGDLEQIALLHEFFGYLLMSSTSLDLQKAGMFIGPPRSGKGLQLQMMRQLLPPNACVGPALQSLGTNFGLAPLIGKQLAIIDDLHLGSRREVAELVSNLKKLTGSGWFTLDRKFKEAWTGTLPVKLVLVANEMPQLEDNSGAMAERFIIFETRQSFLGREDERLFVDKLVPERGGVLLWALKGLRQLVERRRFAESKTSIGLRRRLKKYGSPIHAFVLEEFDFEPDSYVWKDVTFEAWKQYAGDNGYPVGNEAHFSTALFAVGPVTACKPRDRQTGQQRPAYLGLRRKGGTEDLPPVIGGAG